MTALQSTRLDAFVAWQPPDHRRDQHGCNNQAQITNKLCAKQVRSIQIWNPRISLLFRMSRNLLATVCLEIERVSFVSPCDQRRLRSSAPRARWRTAEPGVPVYEPSVLFSGGLDEARMARRTEGNVGGLGFTWFCSLFFVYFAW